MTCLPASRRRLLMTGALPLFLGMALPARAETPDAKAPIHLAAQPLGDALQQLARQTGVDILFSTAAVQGRVAPTVSGVMSSETAASRLLSGSGLELSHSPGGGLVVGSPKPKSLLSKRLDHADRADNQPAERLTVIGRAIRISPSSTPLDVIQPTSRIDAGFIANNIIPLASYDDIVKFQPSVWSQNPNGPGIGKSETLSLRGFQDGQYNVTFDGIPFGDASDLHHTSSSLFIAHDLDQAEVDRGPGTGSTSGNATFGGTIGFRSKMPTEQFGVTTYGTYGSFDTRAGGLEVDTGAGAFGRAFIDLQHEETGGYLTNSGERRTNLMFKDVVDLGPKTTLTVLSTYNKEWQLTTQGATLAEYAKYGNDYGLCSNPALQCYSGYQPSTYQSDFNYAELKSDPSSWLHVSDRIYTNGFEHKYSESTDASQDSAAANGVTFYSPTGKKIATYANDVPGKFADAAFRAYGNMLRLSADVPYATLQAGFWFERSNDQRYTYSIDSSRGGEAVAGKSGSAFSYDINDNTSTYQPYFEADITPFPGTTIKPGVRYSAFVRNFDAALNKTTKVPLDTSQTYTDIQPSIAINQVILPGWTAYAQVARGFLAPPISVFEVQNVGGLKPETTLNYQIGTVARRDRWTVSLDGYYIDFSNYIASTEINVPGLGQQTAYANSAGAIYRGIEAEGQYALGSGFSVYGNYSVNDAYYKHSSVRVAETPSQLAAFGVLFDQRTGPYFSLIGKFVGNRWGLDSVTNSAGNTQFQNQYKIDSTVTADLVLGWHVRRVGGVLRDVTPSIKIANLFNSHAISDFAGNQSAASPGNPNGAPLYWRTAGLSVFFNVTATMP